MTTHGLPYRLAFRMRSLKNWLRRQSQNTRYPALRADVNCLQRSVARRLIEGRHDQWSATVESLDSEDQSLWRMTKLHLPLVILGGIALSDSEKVEALADSLETHFQPVPDPSVSHLLRWFTSR
jgi:hypothetical protein